MFKRVLLRFVLRLLDKSLRVDPKQIDKKAVEDFMYKAFDDRGWRSYFAYEDMKILRELSFGKKRDQYFILIGRRLQLLYIFDAMKQAFENRKSREEKKKAEAQTDNEQP